MRIRSILFGATLVVATAFITSTVLSQDKTKGQDKGMANMPPEAAEMMQKCKEAGTPGENHKVLNNHVGKWNGATKMWMTPDMPTPEESTCTSEIKWIFGNRFLSETVEGTFGSDTFLGQSWGGYDNVTNKYFSTWIDNMSTAPMTSTGTYDAATKTFKYTSTYSCPIAGKTVNGRTVEKWIDNDHFVLEMYGPWPKTGKEYKSMEITFTRAK